MLVPVAIHPGPQCLRANAELPSDIGDRTRTLNHRFDGFTLKLRRKTLPLFRHLTSSIPEKEPIGSHVRNLRGSPDDTRFSLRSRWLSSKAMMSLSKSAATLQGAFPA